MTTTLTPPRILTVDDDPIVRADLRVILEDAGFSVVPDARDGVEAVEHARQHAPDLIVLDLGLPGLDGFDAAATIRSERDVPIVALTGHNAPELLRRASDAGAESYVLKPFSEDGLISAIRAALAKRSARVAAEESRSYHLLLMVESMVRENMSERDIKRAVRQAGGGGSEPAPTLRDAARALARRMGGIVRR
ncbi:MAG: two-component system, response regulator PdtaR [Gaiellales bacterium]|nr:two-component system, response regulator PdtaR [Gaiellales bacterium]